MTPKELMAYAIEKSRKGLQDSGNRPFAALITKDGKIVAEALSRSRTSNDPTAHGEVVAIRMACEALNSRDLKGCEIYTTCEPCSLCVAAIHVANLDRVYYAYTLEDCAKNGIWTTELFEEVSRPIEKRRRPSERLLAEKADEVFKEWIASPHFKR
jgi:guanine deaminase